MIVGMKIPKGGLTMSMSTVCWLHGRFRHYTRGRVMEYVILLIVILALLNKFID